MNDAARPVVPDACRQLASLPIAVILLEPGQRIATVNPVAEQVFGQSQRRLAGRRLTDVLSFGESRIAERMKDSEALISARNVDVAIRGQRPRRVDIATAPVADSPGWQVLTLHDSSAAEALGANSGGPGISVLRGPEILAHEIKNPLAGIRGAAQLLARKMAGADRALTDLITTEVDRIATLIEQMQLLSGRTTAPVEPCNLHEIARRAIAILSAADDHGGNKPRIEEEFDPSLPPVLGNPGGLVQVLINLLSNAREACEGHSEARVVVRTRFASGLQLHSSEAGKPMRLPIELRVSDSGPGVAPTLREHIFEPFVSSKKSGQGLGLSLVRKIVRDMNGRIGHERDETGGWTHFRVHLPLAEESFAVAAGGRKR